ncbi:MAG: TRAP transporter large permease subunit [Pseudomonadota bacterium]
MDISTITLLMAGGIFVLLVMGLPLAFVTASVAVVAALLQFGPNSLFLIASRTYTLVTEFAFVAVPMFIFMASILERSGVAKDLFRAMYIFAGGLRGGLAIQTMMVAVIMAAMTGIIGGEIVLLGLLALPQMLKHGYSKSLAIGTVCAGGSLGTMIPPSIVLIIYGLTANVSIGDLFVATVIPGLVLAALYIAYILIRCYIDPSLGPAASPEERQMPTREKLMLLKGLALPLFVAAFVMGTIYAGIASVSEAAGMGVIGALLSAIIRRELSWRMIHDALRQTMVACGMLLWLTFGANMLIGVYNLMGGTAFVQGFITGLPLEPWMILAVMMLVLIVLGLFMDWIGILLLTMPIFVPAIVALGYDPVWFGVLFCMNMQISYLSPPFGPAAFYLKGVAPPEISLMDIYKALWPFIILQFIGLTLVFAFPDLALWLPRVLLG